MEASVLTGHGLSAVCWQPQPGSGRSAPPYPERGHRKRAATGGARPCRAPSRLGHAPAFSGGSRARSCGGRSVAPIVGLIGRTPDYVNLTFAVFADGTTNGRRTAMSRTPRKLGPLSAVHRAARPVPDPHDHPCHRRPLPRGGGRGPDLTGPSKSETARCGTSTDVDIAAGRPLNVRFMVVLPLHHRPH